MFEKFDTTKVFDSNYLVIVLIGIIIIIVGIVIINYFRPKSRKRDSSIDYMTALNYLLSGEKEKAFEKLIKSVKKDTSNIDAYIKIGDIYREKGDFKRAIKIHLSLTVRNNIETLEKIDIYKSLIKDFRADKNMIKLLKYAKNYWNSPEMKNGYRIFICNY